MNEMSENGLSMACWICACVYSLNDIHLFILAEKGRQ